MSQVVANMLGMNEPPTHRPTFDQRLAALSKVQWGVVARDQLLDFGTRKQIEIRRKSGLLTRVYDSVDIVTAVPWTPQQALLAACFAGGKPSAAAFRAGARLWDLPAGDATLEITSPRHRRVRAHGVVVHESRYLSEADITYIDNIPVTRPARNLIDLAFLVEVGQLAASELQLALQEAVRRNLVDIPQLQAEQERLGGHIRRGYGALKEQIELFTPPLGRCDTEPEMRLLMFLRAAGLPEPTPQHRVWLSPSRWYDLDLAWPELDAYAEFSDYKWHGGRQKYSKDLARLLDLQARGWRGVIVDEVELEAGAPKAIAALRSMLGRRAG